MFKKMVIIEPINMLENELNQLYTYAEQVIAYKDIPSTNEEKIKRIGDADSVLLSYTSTLDGEVLKACPHLKYVGMCCSLYSKESANVDIEVAEALGITVKGIRDYGDEGVGEYVAYELINLLQGYHGLKWDDMPRELSSLKCGIVGLGTSGTLIAETLKFFKCKVSYYSRTRKYAIEEKGISYMPLHDLLKSCDAIFLALNKNVILLHEEEFNLMTGRRILFNTSIGPGHDVDALKKWVKEDKHFFFCDTINAFGDDTLFDYPNCKTINRSAGGKSKEAYIRLGEKVLANIDAYFHSSK